MVKDAELNAAEDKKKLELVQAKNQADASVHSVKKSLTEYGDKLKPVKKKIEAAIKELEEAIKSDDKDAIDAKNTALMTASQKLGERCTPTCKPKTGCRRRCCRCRTSRWCRVHLQGQTMAPQMTNVVDAEVKEVKKG